MKRNTPNDLGICVSKFFQDHLPAMRGMSTHTIRSYRDAIVLYLRFAADQLGKPPDRLDLGDLNARQVAAFVVSLEQVRGNGIGTRNARLAALHTLVRFALSEYPQHMAELQRVLGVPFKRRDRREPLMYLEENEVEVLLKLPDRPSQADRRSHALFSLMFNTGARVQEALDLRVCDVRMAAPCQVRLQGKGGKIRICPIWPQTAAKLQQLIDQLPAPTEADSPLFVNHRGQKLTRFGVRYLLRQRVAGCIDTIGADRARQIHPHTLRHTTAVHLLRAGVDFATISQWLGHASLTTTMNYARADLDLKRQALAQVFPDVLAPPKAGRIAPQHLEIIEWLRRL